MVDSCDVGVVHEPVDRGGGGRWRGAAGRTRPDGTDRDRPTFVGGVDDAERLAGFVRDGEQPDVDDHEVGFEDPVDGLGGVVDCGQSDTTLRGTAPRRRYTPLVSNTIRAPHAICR